jgi:hypothetical protein
MFAIGLDLGQKRDHTAIVVVERQRRHPFLVGPDKELLVRAAERLPLGMTYGEIVDVVRHVVRVLCSQLGPQEVCKMAVDATGVGKPVVDALRDAQLGCSMTAVTITSGDRQHYRSKEGSSMNVPKQNLIAGLQLALDQRTLRISKKMAGAFRLTLRSSLYVPSSPPVRGLFRAPAADLSCSRLSPPRTHSRPRPRSPWVRRPPPTRP